MTTWITPQIDRLHLSAALMMNVGCSCECGGTNGAGSGGGS